MGAWSAVSKTSSLQSLCGFIKNGNETVGWCGCVLRLTLSEIPKSPIPTTHGCCLFLEGSWHLSKILASALCVVLWTTLFAAQGYNILSRLGYGSFSTSQLSLILSKVGNRCYDVVVQTLCFNLSKISRPYLISNMNAVVWCAKLPFTFFQNAYVGTYVVLWTTPSGLFYKSSQEHDIDPSLSHNS
jgi:hypothetical protein